MNCAIRLRDRPSRVATCGPPIAGSCSSAMSAARHSLASPSRKLVLCAFRSSLVERRDASPCNEPKRIAICQSITEQDTVSA